MTLGAGCSEVKALQYSLGMAPPPPPPPTQAAYAAAAPEGTVALQPLAPVRRDIFTRSYRLGEPYTVHTGQPVVSIKNYSVTEKVGHATVLRDFAQNCTGGWPRRKVGRQQLGTAASFVGYVNAHKTEATAVYANKKACTFTAILNDRRHGKALRDDLRAGISTLPAWMQAIVRELLN